MIGSRLQFIYSQGGDVFPDQGLVFIEKSLKILLDEYGKNNIKVAALYNFLSYEYYKLGENYNKAFDYMNESKTIQLEILGDNSYNLWRCYNVEGLLLIEKNDFDTALNSFNMALDLIRKENGEIHDDIAVVYNNISEVYLRQNNHNKAKEYLEKNYKILSNIYSKGDPVILRQYNQLYLDYNRMKDFKSAIKYLILFWENSLERKGGPAYDIYICYKNLNQSKEAIHWLEQAALLRKERLTLEHETTQSTILELVNYAKELGEVEMEKKWDSEINKN